MNFNAQNFEWFYYLIFFTLNFLYKNIIQFCKSVAILRVIKRKEKIVDNIN